MNFRFTNRTGGVSTGAFASLNLGSHVGEAEGNSLMLGDWLAKRLALLGILNAEFECPTRKSTGAGSDIDAAHLNTIHHLVKASAGCTTEDR